MQKFIGIIISIIVIAGLAVGGYFVVVNYLDDQEHTLVVSTTEGGKAILTINDDEYTISANSSAEYKVKRTYDITLNAIPNSGYALVNWTKNGSDLSSDLEIEINVSKKTSISANFAISTHSITVNGAVDSETFDLSIQENLLEKLNSKFSAPAGYKYVYKIGSNIVDEDTIISEDTTIVVEKVLVEFTVTFKNGDTTVATENYSIEDKSITEPSVPVENGYTFAWENYNLDILGNIVVNAIKTPIEYTIKFVLPTDYKFADETSEKSLKYIITDETVTAPSLETIEVPQHYYIAWPSYTLNYDNTNELVVTAQVAPIEYTVTFKNGDTTVATEKYTIENKAITEPTIDLPHYENETWDSYDLNTLTDIVVNLNKTATEYSVKFMNGTEEVTTKTYTIESLEVIAPEVPSIDHYNTVWESFDTSTLTNIIVNVEKTPIEYTATFTLPGDYVFEDGSKSQDVKYTIENYTEAVIPTLPAAASGYSIAWPVYNLGELKDMTISAIVSEVEYTATFVLPSGYTFDNGSNSFDQKFTIGSINSISIPNIPTTAKNDLVRWPTFSADINNLSNFTVNAIKLVLIDVDCDIATNHLDTLGFTTSNYKYDTLFILNGRAYESNKTNSNQVLEIVNLANFWNSCITNSNNKVAHISKIKISDGTNTSELTIDGNLETKLNEALLSCTTNAHSLDLVYDFSE